MQLERAIEYFLIAKRAEGRAAGTIDSYGQALYQFMTQMPDVGDTNDLDVHAIRAYIATMQEGHLAATTVANRTIRLKAFCNWLEREEVLRVSPFARGRVRVPSVPQSNMDTITDDEFRAMIAACNPRNSIGRRDVAMLMLLMDTGVRVSEAVGLDVADVNLAQRTAQLRVTKGKRERTVFFSPQTALALTRYLGRRRKDDGKLFMPIRQHASLTRITTGAFRERLEKLAIAAGIDPKRVHPHAFRHTMATNYLREGGDPASLQAMLGHSDVSTTVRNYAHLVTADLQKKHDQFSSMDRLAGRKKRP